MSARLAPWPIRWRGGAAIRDGELVVCTDGAVDFYPLAGRMAATGRTAQRAAAAMPVTLVIFDGNAIDQARLGGCGIVVHQ